MPREHNFLLGNGERLTGPVDVPSGGGDKNPPYDAPTAKRRIRAKLETAYTKIAELPDDACPNGEAVMVLTMHPRYVSKSDYPKELLAAAGLRSIGSRSREVKPEAWGVERHEESALAEDIFVAGPRTAFRKWAADVEGWASDRPATEQLGHVEDVFAIESEKKLRAIPTDTQQVMLEVVLHNDGNQAILDSFFRYAKGHDAKPRTDLKRDVGGLTFVPVEVERGRAGEVAAFSFVRVARGMPTMRPLGPSILRAIATKAAELPTEGPLDDSFRAVIFDGGLPADAAVSLSRWVTYVEPAGIGPALRDAEEHGLAVTSAFLFGSLAVGAPAGRPACMVDHVRVFDSQLDPTDPQYVVVLDRILNHLDAEPGKYHLVNLSLGPDLAVDDDEVTRWTAELDQRFSHGKALATVAAGNGGERDAAARLNRIQPPADGVNVLSVGACETSAPSSARASFSCVGPGRCPGIVKPDGLAFGGSDGEDFFALGPGLRVRTVVGTSFAAPSVLHAAALVKARAGQAITPLGLRALLIHHTDFQETDRREETGWGRFLVDPDLLLTCDDDEAVVLFQGELPVGEHLRVPIPLPADEISGRVLLTGTLVIAPDVDPEYPGAYTRGGLDVMFRPHEDVFTEYDDGERSAHPKTKPFFSEKNLYGTAEYQLKEEGQKWEPCRKASVGKNASSLKKSCFDIYYHHREGLTSGQGPRPIPYAFVIGMKAAKVPDFYSRVVRSYAQVLIPVRPKIQVPVTVRANAS